MIIASFMILMIISLFGNLKATVNDNLIVELAQPHHSKIRGHCLLSVKGHEYYSFQEIPYAEPPVGQLRFKPPVPHNGWNGILNTTKNTKKCLQPSLLNQTDEMLIHSEDCLYLNVYTPVKPGSNKSLPVFVFIHGGGLTVGDGTFNTFGPKYLMDGNVIVVTMNYRLGPFGFLSTRDDVISGNMGLKDQLRAIEWTHENIHLFGGNQNDIVIGGQSAGSFSVAYHLLNPKIEGFVSASIQQSGSSISFAVHADEARQRAMAIGKCLDRSLDSDNSSSLLSVLLKASGEDILRASYQELFSADPLNVFGPVLEDTDADQPIITIPVHQAFMEGNFIRVPSMMGFNSEESVVLLSLGEELIEDAARFDSDPSLLLDGALNVENKTLVGTKYKALYTSTSFLEDLDAYVKYSSDILLNLGSIRQAELASKYIPVHLYQLSAGDNTDDRFPGVGHGYDLVYLFDYHGKDSYMPDFWKVDGATREVLLTLWWNFIKYKNPTPEKDPILENVDWPTTEPNNLVYLNLNYSLSIESNPKNYYTMRDFFLKYFKQPF